MRAFCKQLSAILLLALPLCTYGQRTVKGNVYEAGKKGRKTALPYATVQVLGAAIGTSADSNGAFAIEVPDSSLSFIVSAIGYEQDTIAVPAGSNSVSVKLYREARLGEVTVRGKQASTRLNLGGARKMETLGEAELMKAACCNLSESFETTPSIDVAFTDAVTGYKQISMLGLAGPYTLMTRENIPDVRGLAAVTGLMYTPGQWIESIQLSKGTGSVVNGPESVAGQINVELRKPKSDEKALVNLYQNSQGRTEANVVINHRAGKKVQGNTFLHGSYKWLKTDNNGDGFLDKPLGSQLAGVHRWLFSLPKGYSMQAGVKGVYFANTGGQWGYEKGMPQQAGNPWGYELNTKRVETWAKAGRVFLNKPGTSIGLQLSGVYHDQDAMYGTRTYSALQKSLYANLIFQSIIKTTDHVIKAGVSGMADHFDEVFDKQHFIRTETTPGAFVEYAYTSGDRFNLVAGLRGDYDNLFGAFASPRLHIRYAPFKRTALRASVGRSWRTANIFAENIGLMASGRQFEILNPALNVGYGLRPEIAWTSGLNLTQKFTLNYREGAVSVDFYHTDFQEQVVVDAEFPGAVLFYNLRGPSRSNSFHAQVDYELIHNLDLRLAYRYYDVQTTYGTVMKQWRLVPPHRAFMNVGYKAKKHWKFDYTLQWIGPKRVPALLDATGAEMWSRPYVLMNAQVAKGWENGWEVYVGSENLANFMQRNAIVAASNPFSTAFDASQIWGPVMGRTIYAGLRLAVK